MDGWYELTCKDGTVLDFNRKCDCVDYTDERVVVFKNDLENGYLTLAIVPYSEIGRIIAHRENE